MVMSLKSWVSMVGLCVALIAPTPIAIAAPDAAPKKDNAAWGLKVDGFRSAKYGMAEKELRAAIKKDFNIEGDAVTVYADPTERTTSLIVAVNDLLPDSGPAAVAYIMGFKSKALFRVNVLWGHGVSDKLSAQQVTGLANALRNYLTTQGYNPNTIVVNTQLGDGSFLVFRGDDSQNRQTELVLTPISEPLPEDNTKSAIVGATLRLSYIEKPAAPDIFSISNGF